MVNSLARADARTRLNVVLFAIFFGALLIFGGASRGDVLSLPIARIASVVMIGIALVQIRSDQWREIWTPLIFLLAVAAIIAAQLVPLPPTIWQGLPGRERYVEALALVGLGSQWRSASLTPDLTLNSLLAILPPLAVVLGLGIIERPYHRLLVPLILVAIAVSALVGLLQISSGTPYFYRITNEGAAVGFFSNRNHLAVFIAIALPLVATWASFPHDDASYRQVRFWIALCIGAAVFPLLLTTGSRAGLALGGVGALLALALPWRVRWLDTGWLSVRRGHLLALVPIAIGAAAVAVTIFFSRDVALRRLFADDQIERRSANLPHYLDMVRDFFPVGAGFGSFDPVFRAYEPQALLSIEYMNQAHNDWIQVMIEGGASSLLLMLVFLVWFSARSWSAWARPVRSTGHLLARCGSAIVFLLLLSSIVEYPMRTPFLAAVMAIAAIWLVPRIEDSAAKNAGE
jgi:O-antigen ligase